MQLLSLKFSTGWFMPFQMVPLSCRMNFPNQSRQGFLTYTGDLPYVLCHWVWSSFNVCWAEPSMQYRSPIDLKSNHRNIPHSAGIAHASTQLHMSIALLKSLSAEVVWRKDISKPIVIPPRRTNLLLQWTAVATFFFIYIFFFLMKLSGCLFI